MPKGVLARLWGSAYFRSAVGTYGTQLLVLPLSLAASVLQARLLGPTGRGQVVLVSTTANIAVLYLGFGLGSAITFHVAGGRVSPARLVRPLSGVVTVAVLTLATILCGLRAVGLSELAIGSLRFSLAAGSVVGLFLLLLINGLLTAVLVARKEFSFINRVSLAVFAIPILGYSTALNTSLPVSPTFFVIGVLLVAELVRSFMLGARTVHVERHSHRETGAPQIPLRSMVGYSLLAYACDAIQYLSYRIDVWIVRHYRGDAELGRYSLAVTLAEMVLLLASAFATVLFPYVPSLDADSAVRLTVRVASGSFVASAALSILGYLVAVPLVPVLFTRAFAPSVPLLGILLLGIVPMSLAKILGNYIAGIGALRLSLVSAMVGMVVCVALDLTLIPRMGARGAAIASVIAYIAFTLCLSTLFVSRAGVRPRELVQLAASPFLALRAREGRSD